MKRIDISAWKEFTLESLFDIVKGTRLTRQDMREGDINYIGATAFNNGITSHIGNDEHLHPEGTLTVAYNGSIGQTFYQEEPFWATDDVNVLYPKFAMTKPIAMFIAPLIKSVGKNYVYTDKWQLKDMKRSSIFLPTTADGTPDWAYMEAYMQGIGERARQTVSNLSKLIGGGKRKQLKTSGWREFKVGDLFDASNTGNILARDIADGSGSTPYVTASGVNNGVAAHIDARGFDKIQGNCILVGGKTFTLTYQREDFVSNDSHNIELHLKNRGGGASLYLFVITALRRALAHKYQWGDAVTKPKLLEQTLLLPARKDGSPDWAYMEGYMQAVATQAAQRPAAQQRSVAAARALLHS